MSFMIFRSIDLEKVPLVMEKVKMIIHVLGVNLNSKCYEYDG